ncbi:MAG: hypothetical protein OEN23_02520 [Paracoccaceae bacterium]|nr:hypothetical protein [Paracoccaceae bacterium]
MASAKTAEHFIGCLIPRLETMPSASSAPAQQRTTQTGYEIIMLGGYQNVFIMAMVVVDRDGTGSTAVGYATDDYLWSDDLVADVSRAMTDCV